MDWTEFVTRVSTATGETSDESIEAALRHLARYVPAFDAQQMTGQLPPAVVDALSNDDDLQRGKALLAPPGNDSELSDGHALELYATVCRVIDNALDDAGSSRFRRNLSRDLIATFVRSPASHNPPTGGGHELADGRPGSASPLSEANPAQADSIARDDDPHGSTKLSGAEGTTQERLNRTLAEGEPGSSRPLSDHKP